MPGGVNVITNMDLSSTDIEEMEDRIRICVVLTQKKWSIEYRFEWYGHRRNGALNTDLSGTDIKEMEHRIRIFRGTDIKEMEH